MTDQSKPFPLYRICEALGACPYGLLRLQAFAGRPLADWIREGDYSDLIWLRRSSGLPVLVHPRQVNPRELQIGLARKALAGDRNFFACQEPWDTRKPLTATEKADLRRRLQAFGA